MINCETFELTGSDNVKFLVDRFSTSYKANKIIIFCHGFKGFKDWGGLIMLLIFLLIKILYFINLIFRTTEHHLKIQMKYVI